MPRMMYDDPTDEMTKPPHAEPEGDESYIDDIMGKDLEGEDEDLFGKESPLEAALIDAGYKVSPEQLSQIEEILSQPAKKPSAKPPVGGLAKPPSAPVKPMGGAVPAGMGSGDLPVR